MIMQLYRREVHCLVCGTFLLKAGEGTSIILGCKKCHHEFDIKLHGGMLDVQEVMDETNAGRSPMVRVSTQKKGSYERQRMMA